MNNNILYLSINSSYSHSSLAYGQLRTLSEKYVPGWNWQIVEYTISDNSLEIVNDIIHKNPRIIISTAYLFNIEFLLKIIKKTKVILTNLTIVLGGPEFLGNNKSFLNKNPEINAVFRGDENTFPKFLNLFSSPDRWSSIKGLCTVNDKGEYIDNGTSETEEINSLPSLYSKGYFNKNKPFMQLETSRGCPSKCIFCTSSLGRDQKFYETSSIKDSLYEIKYAGISEVRILDRTFNLPPRRAAELLSLFRKEFSDLRFHLEFNPSKLHEEVFNELLKTPPNHIHIEAGIQTFSTSVLKAIKRDVELSKTEYMTERLCNINNIQVHADLLAGLPEQDYDSVLLDIKKLVEIGPNEIQLELLKALPGTPIREKFSNKIFYSPLPPYEVLKTDKISTYQILFLSYISKTIDIFYNSSETRSIFRFAITNFPDFLNEFIQLNMLYITQNSKPSLKNKFNMLVDYAELKNDSAFLELIKFAKLIAGLINPDNEHVKLIKKHDIPRYNAKVKCNLWTDNKPLIQKPAYLVNFNINACELWLNPFVSIKESRNFYFIRLSKSGMSKGISRIDLITKE